jgi:hypothetical protein
MGRRGMVGSSIEGCPVQHSPRAVCNQADDGTRSIRSASGKLAHI